MVNPCSAWLSSRSMHGAHIARRWFGLMWIAATFGAGAAATPVELHPQQVADNVWFVQGEAAVGSADNGNFISNAGFVVTDDGVVVIDALGAPALGQALIAAIGKITDRPIRCVILTHYHADHIYGLQAFKAVGATILAHREGRAYLESEHARLRLEASRQDLAPWIDEYTVLVPPDRWLDAPETTLKVGQFDIVIRHVGPAHTPEDLSVYVPARGVLFAGDLVFRGRIPYVGQADSERWIASLNRLIALRPRLLVPGHGPASTEPLADLETTRDYLLFLRRAMKEAADNLEPFDEAYAKVDWSRFAQIPLFGAANRMNAYNTYLLMQQKGLR